MVRKGPVPRIHYMARLIPRGGPPRVDERRVWVSRLSAQERLDCG